MTFDPTRADSDDASPSNPLGDALTPKLLEECGGRLTGLDWFHSPWQNGGGSTAFATWTTEDGRQVPALVKVPVGYRELFWTENLSELTGDGRIAADQLPTPRVFACGDRLNGYDLAWLVTERLEGLPLAQAPTEEGVIGMLEATADFQAAAAAVRPPMEGLPPAPPDWDGLIGRARDLCRGREIANGQRWNEALKKVCKLLPGLIERWAMRPIDSWCHGDLHAANALRRSAVGTPTREGSSEQDGRTRAALAAPEGRTVLIDLAMVHAGCWIEDAVYLERTCWSHPESLCGVKPVTLLARKRRERGLPVCESAPELANIRRVLMAASTLAHHARHGDAQYTNAALAQVERTLPRVARQG